MLGMMQVVYKMTTNGVISTFSQKRASFTRTSSSHAPKYIIIVKGISTRKVLQVTTNNMLSAWPCDVIQLPLIYLNTRKNIGKIRLEMECAEKCRKCSNKSTLPTNALLRKQLRIGIRQLACICQPAALRIVVYVLIQILKDISAACVVRFCKSPDI